MATVIIEQFNPASGCWNKLREMDSTLYNPAILNTLNKYGGPMRTRIAGEVVVEEVVVDDIIEEEVFEEEEEKEVFEDDIPQYDDADDSRWQ